VSSCAILSPVSERKTMTEIYGTNYAGFIRRTLKATKHPFIPREEPVDETFVPRTNMEEHTLENWGKLPEGWTPAKELENNLKDIRRNLKNSA
jgi:hypothetical protein